MIDLIGDIHGHTNELKALLHKMGYERKNGVYSHPERKVLFVGDYIDRGPKIRETLKIVRSMAENENAIALMGNHEYNALCYHTIGKSGKPLREHSDKNIQQHQQTLVQFKNHLDEFKDYLNWFKSLPLYYETEDFRAVHACWNDKNIAFLRNKLINDRLTDELLEYSIQRETEFYKAVDQTLKGMEINLPNGITFKDKDGHERNQIRIKWWENPIGMSYKSISIVEINDLANTFIDTSKLSTTDYYKLTDKKVFFGHYWLNGEPLIYKDNVCCLDYSVAKGGKLVAYRFDKEIQLKNNRFVCV